MSGEQTWFVIDADGEIVNRVSWDGVAEWAPPEGCTVVLESPAASAPVSNTNGAAK